MKKENERKSHMDRMTLKNRILLLFAAATLIPFIFTCYVSYNTITSILNTKLQSGIQSNLKQVRLSFENTLSNLNHVSQQLAFEGNIGKQLELFLTADKPYDRSYLTDQIKYQLNLITFTNPNIGLTMYYFGNDGTIHFENMGVKDSFDIENLPIIAEYYGITYFGPHMSNDRFNNQYVFSALRKVELPEREDAYVYIESGFKLTQSVLDLDGVSKHTDHLILDNNGRISYSELNDVFPENSSFPGLESPSLASGVTFDYYWYRQISNQGWSVVSLIAKSDYNQEKNRWFMQMIVLAVLFAAVGLAIGWLLWKMVYRPLSKFNKEIRWMANSNFNAVTTQSRIPEFEALLTQFRHMKVQIAQLYSEVEIKEKRRADLEIEKLLYQINPHFLMNTLDTAHWLAVMNGQEEIDRLVTSLNKLLYYNLGKGNSSSTIREEIDSLKQYLILQQIRYDFHFDVRLQVDDELLDLSVPRFILQPLVENALYHGLEDDGRIEVNVTMSDRLEIEIRDNGGGISDETILALLEQEQTERHRVGMGIGMNYVKRMLESHYDGHANLSVTSKLGKGTVIVIQIPIAKEDNQS
ncbi:two-component system sensor histidine kinase YesM [Paenibacillus endophyticus]|uniref:histidine kinase n=1 Tax=Paenibacillus endophyticus TaxID=1294268 RepID=A0A7W5CCU8_9BACL|nr:histidine kinase [Paenibacillus endophyticus]MBB3155376.1 two-component system sensor histidine kinase YesM [Paenibacillus endophyticus]